MGVCSDDGKKVHTWGESNNNVNGRNNKENTNKNDNDYIMKKREEYYKSNEFKKKAIFNND